MSDYGEGNLSGVSFEGAQNPALNGDASQSSTKKDTQLQEKNTPLNILMRKIELIVTENDGSPRKQQEDQFIKERLLELEKLSEPTSLSLIEGSRHKGFIHPETQIKRNFTLDAVMINDVEIYRLLLESFRQFKENPAWQNKSMREIALHALLRTLGLYFGNYYGIQDVESRNKQFYLDHSDLDSEAIPISEFRGKNMGVCAEKAAVAQNLLTFMGYDSELVMSTNCSLSPQDDRNTDGHAYNVISSDRGYFIFDPTNPVIVKKTDGSLITVLPSIYPISENQYKKLMEGGQVEVTHNDLIWDGNGYQKQEDKKRVYGGPKANLLDKENQNK